MVWPTTTITTDSGDKQSAIAPIIISASRSTDIPAFYGDWFRRRLERGYARWVNPWNGTSQYVSFDKTRMFVFWSKNPRPFFPLLDELDRRGYGYFFHVTLNDYEDEGLEPYVPPLTERIETLRLLSRRLGRERVIWRFDPVLLTPDLSAQRLLARIGRIGDAIASDVDRLIFSVISLYAKVARNLMTAGVTLHDRDRLSYSQVLEGIGAFGVSWGLPVCTCAMDLDATKQGIGRGKCIDGAYLMRTFGGDSALMAYLHHGGNVKDRGQRRHCGCISSKDIGSYNTCGHGCRYCYANYSARSAREKAESGGGSGDAINDYSSYTSSAGTAGSSLS